MSKKSLLLKKRRMKRRAADRVQKCRACRGHFRADRGTPSLCPNCSYWTRLIRAVARIGSRPPRVETVT